MRKYYCFIVILALILTAPLSFTGDKCPDFKPDVEIQQVTTIKKNIPTNIRKLAVAIAAVMELSEPAAPVQTHSLKTVITSTETTIFHDRAPPIA